MAKARPLCTSAKSNLGDTVLGEAEKSSFIALPGKGGHYRLLSWITMCPNLGGFDEEFYSNDSRVGLLLRLGCVQGLHFSILVSGGLLDELLSFLSCSLRWSFSGMKNADILKSLKTLVCVSLEVEPEPCPKPAILFPGCHSLVFAFLPFLD